MRNKKRIIVLAVVALLLVAGSVATIGWKYHERANTSKQIKTQHTISYKGVNGQTALALLKKHAQVTVQNSSYGPFVETIDGLRGGSGGKYWMFYVKDKEASVGASAFVTKNGEIITWKFQ